MLAVTLTLAALGGIGPPSASSEDLTGQLGRAPRQVDTSGSRLFQLRWRERVVRTGLFRDVTASFGRPAVSSRYHLVILGTGEGRVEARRLRDGKLIWAYDHGAPFETEVLLVDVPSSSSGAAASSDSGAPRAAGSMPAMTDLASRQLAILGSRNGTLLALDAAKGTLVWSVDVGGDVRAAPSLSGLNLVVANAANRITALDVRDGAVLWGGGRPPPGKLTIIGHARPLIYGDTVFGAFSDGYVCAYALADGTQRWARPLSIRGADFVDADADPVMADGRLFVASYSDGVFALDPADGKTLWARAAPATVSLATHGPDVIAGSGDGFVWGFGRSDGRLAFRTKIPAGMVTRIAVRDDMLVFGGGQSGLVVLDASDGRPLQALSFGSRMNSAPAWVEDLVTVLSANGFLYAFARGGPGPSR